VFLFNRSKRKYFAACEYWVYLPGEEMPEQDAIMTRMIAQNPHSRSGHSAIGAKEGILFSDIRLHLGLVLRSKNTHVFRPDLFQDCIEPSAAVLEGLSKAHSLLKARYVSEEPLTDDRHLQFMPHMADAVAELARGLVVYDVVAERLFTSDEFMKLLSEDLSVTRFDAHVRTVWQKDVHSGHAETKGLVKKGIPELCTDDAHLDQQVLVCEVLTEAAKQLWDLPDIPPDLQISAFEDHFRLEISPTRTGPFRVRILRMMQP